MAPRIRKRPLTSSYSSGESVVHRSRCSCQVVIAEAQRLISCVFIDRANHGRVVSDVVRAFHPLSGRQPPERMMPSALKVPVYLDMELRGIGALL